MVLIPARAAPFFPFAEYNASSAVVGRTRGRRTPLTSVLRRTRLSAEDRSRVASSIIQPFDIGDESAPGNLAGLRVVRRMRHTKATATAATRGASAACMICLFFLFSPWCCSDLANFLPQVPPPHYTATRRPPPSDDSLAALLASSCLCFCMVRLLDSISLQVLLGYRPNRCM